MKHPLLQGFLLIAGATCYPGFAVAQPTVTGVVPGPSGQVARTGTVSVGFSRPLHATSAPALRVFSAQQGGKKAGQAVVTANQLSFTPTTGFVAGEPLWATLTTAARDTGSVPLARPWVWQFNAAVASSTGAFTQVANLITASPSNGGGALGSAVHLATADLDGDGDQDILSVNNNATISIRSNDGTGQFFPLADQAIAYVPSALTLGDVDGDGDVDLALVGGPSVNSAGYYTVYLNNGQGVFTSLGNNYVGGWPTAVGLADLDGDSDLDLVYSVDTRYGYALRNNGAGIFGGNTGPVLLGQFGTRVAAGDIDNDGDIDLIGLDNNVNQVTFRVNLGQMAFTTPAPVSVSANPQQLRVADLDKDGDLDLLTLGLTTSSTGYAYSLSVRLGSGTGSFSGPASLTLTGLVDMVRDIRLTDVEGDGDPDLLLTSGAGISIWLNNGSGAFSAGATVALYAPSVFSTTDIDGDGDVDMLASYYGNIGNLAVFRNGVAAPVPYTVTAVGPVPNTTAPRMASVTATFSTPMSGAPAATAALQVYGSRGKGKVAGAVTAAGNSLTLTPTTAYLPGELVQATVTKAARSTAGAPLTRPYVWQFVAAATGGSGLFGGGSLVNLPAVNPNPRCMRLGDIDGDGDLDIVTSVELRNSFSGPLPPALSVLRNNGAGVFAAPVPLLAATIAAYYDFDLADLDGDGDLDFVGRTLMPDPAGGYNPLTPGDVWLNNGQGTFTANGLIPNIAGGIVATGDVDGDGDLDLLMGGVRFNDGHGTFYGPASGPGGEYGAALVDLDNDGDLDCLTTSSSFNGHQAFFNDGLGTFTTGVYACGGFPSSIMARDMDGDGDVDIVTYGYNSTVIALNDGQGAFTTTSSRATGYPIAVGDIDGDNDVDLLTAGGFYLNTGQGTFQFLDYPAWMTTTGAYASTLASFGDLDGDGDLDLVMVNSAFSNGPYSAGWQIRFNTNRVLATTAAAAAPLAVWPNPVPAGGRLRVDLPQPVGAGTIRLSTLLGQAVWEQAITSKADSWLLPVVPTGVYLLTVQGANQAPLVRRVVVE